jgi:hypothetical protein
MYRGSQAMGPRHSAWFGVPDRDVDLCSCQRIRGAANGKVETSRGRKSPAREYMGSTAGVSPQAAYLGEARA